MGVKPSGDGALWVERMGAKGWGTPTWPKEYGGGGLSPAEAKVLAEEMAAIGANNPIGGMGVMMFGPTLLEYGNEEQKQRHIPPICRGEIRWCQGYSEPNAGSDLAALQTRAEDMGDHYLVNGQKIWTSGAQFADWCFCLVRTDKTKKHEGISFLLIDMTHAGHRSASDPADLRRLALLRDFLHRCEGAEGKSRRPAQWRLDHRQAAVAARTLGPVRRRHAPVAAATRAASPMWRRIIWAPTSVAASPMPICAPASRNT